MTDPELDEIEARAKAVQGSLYCDSSDIARLLAELRQLRAKMANYCVIHGFNCPDLDEDWD